MKVRGPVAWALAGGALAYTLTARARYRKQRKAVSALNSILHDNIAGIRQIKTYTSEEREHARFDESSDKVRIATLTVMKSWALYQPGMEFLSSLGLLIVAGVGTTQVLGGQLEIGALVACNSYRNPELLADMARTIDHISEGRFVLGLGSGWFERDYTEYGYEFGTAVDRLKLLEAGLPVIKDRMKKLNPQPVNGNIPIMIGGGGEKRTLRLVAEHAQQYNYFGPPESYANKIKILDEWCAKVGRNPKEIERTVAIYPKEVTPELFEAYKQAGAEHIILTSAGPFDMKDLETLLSWR